MQEQQRQPKLRQNRNKNNSAVLPPIPEKLYFTIGEVSSLCLLKPHVLRYWEQEFTQLAPSKRRGNRRYYQRDEVILIRRIKSLLYEQGFTIEGARTKLASEKGGEDINAPKSTISFDVIQNILTHLESVVAELEIG